MLPRGNRYARGKLIVWEIDAYGNAVGRTNNNPILDTREYCLEFDDGEVNELMVKMISESMYAECDDSINEYLMMDSIVDYRKSDKAISVCNQKVVCRGRIFMRKCTIRWHL